MMSGAHLTLTPEQETKLRELVDLGRSFNEKINLYSKASADAFWTRHIEHSLVLARKPFAPSSRVVDWGTGGGMPGLPLAIVFPEVKFVLVDAVRKKVQAVHAMARRLELSNVETWHGRAEVWEGEITHSVSRATAPLATLWDWHRRVECAIATNALADAWPPGLLCLKGGDLSEEIRALTDAHPGTEVIVTPLRHDTDEPIESQKAVVEVYRKP